MDNHSSELIITNILLSLFLGLGFYIFSYLVFINLNKFKNWAIVSFFYCIGWISLITGKAVTNEYPFLVFGFIFIIFSIAFSIYCFANLLKIKLNLINYLFLFILYFIVTIYTSFERIFSNQFESILFFSSIYAFFLLSYFILNSYPKNRISNFLFILFLFSPVCLIVLRIIFDQKYLVYYSHVQNFRLKIMDVSLLGYYLLSTFGFLYLHLNLSLNLDKSNEDKLKKLTMGMEQSLNSVIITNVKGEIEYVNSSFTEVTGYLPEEVIGKNPRIFKSGYTKQEEYAEIWRVICQGGKWKGIFQNRKKNGDLYWESTTISPLKNHAGDITHFISIKENITPQILAEKKLKESEEKYRVLMQTSMDLIHITDMKGNLLDYNFAFLNHLGYSQEEAKYLNVRDWDVKWTDTQLKEIIQSLLEKPSLFETVHRRKDGLIRYVEINAVGVEIRGEYFLYSSGRDITERKQNEIDLIESEEKFKSFFKLNKAIFLLIDPLNGNIIDANMAAENYYGYSFEELTNMNISGINTLSHDEISQEMQRATHFKRNYFNFKHKLKSGKTRDVEVYATPISVNQKIILFSIVHDVTERKMAERLLKESETRLKLALEGAKEGTWDWNIQTGHVTFDSYWAEMLGYELTEIKPEVSSWEKLLHPDDREIALGILKKHLQGETEAYQVEHRMKTKSGKWKWILGHGKVIERNESGAPMRAIGTHVDIDIYKVAHEELRVVSEKLKESNATKDKFFSIISHDLRGPIGNINSLLEFITDAKNEIPDNEYDQLLSIIKSSAKNIYILLENLLVWSRAQRGLIKYNPFKYNLHELVKSNINLFAISAKNKKISLNNLVEKEVFAFFDFEMIDTVIRNLISNSIKYTNENGEISISSRESIDAIEIVIKDNGIGMSKEIMNSLFRVDVKQPSVQGTNGEKGSRLGLILCKEFIDRHNGEIKLISEPNIGTEFIIRLPVVK